MKNIIQTTRARHGRLNIRLMVFLAIVSFPFLAFGYMFINYKATGGIEHHSGYDEVNLKAMGNFPFDQNAGSLILFPLVTDLSTASG